MKKDCGIPLSQLLVDGVMSQNNLLMQLQADLTGIPVVRPDLRDATALGVAIAAGSAAGVEVWDRHDLVSGEDFTFNATTTEQGLD